MRYLVKTLGCKANLYDSQLLEAELQRRGWQAAGEGDAPDLCVVNSCTVTDQADRETRRLAQRLARRHPGARVVVTGCGAEVDPRRLESVAGIDYIVGNRDKPQLVELLLEALPSARPEHPQVLGRAEGYEALRSRHPMDREWPLPELPLGLPLRPARGSSARTRAFLKIQEGCDAFCTFCIIPYARGPQRSLRPREVVAQVRALVAAGVNELVLTGTNLGDYGAEWGEGPALDGLVETLLSGTDLPRLRISSLDPTELTPRLLALAAREPRLCPHFHVSLQSPHPAILKGMKRRYPHEAVRPCLEALAALPAPPGGAFVGMDLIAGFPGETDEIFDWTLQALDALPWTRLHVFPYSERQGTPATRLPGAVPIAERRRRTRVLADASLARLQATYAAVLAANTVLEDVLLEGRVKGPDGAALISGHTRNFLRVLLPAGGLRENTLVRARPHGILVDAPAGEAAFLAEPA